jgi:hypothetical protein
MGDVYRGLFAYVSSQYVCKSFFRTQQMTAMLLQERVCVLSRCVFVGCWSLKVPAAVSCLKRSFTTKLVNKGETRHWHVTPGPPYVVEVFTGYAVPTASKFPGKIGLFLSSRVGGRYSDSLRTGRSGDRISLGARFSATVQPGSGAHPNSCTMLTGSLPGVKWLGRGVYHPPPPPPPLSL